MNSVSNKEDFINSSMLYLDELKSASNFDEMLELWRKTSIPYSMGNLDPYSPDYTSRVMDIYKGLTNSEYHPNNELTSTKQSEQDFEIGFPWISGNLRIVAEELAKPVQILQALHQSGKSGARIIEFGCGWGNLALPLARARQDVTVVDIDEGFLNRVRRKAEKENLTISTHCGEFIEVADSITSKFDVVIFQSSFHHCIDFMKLLSSIRENVLVSDGIIIFASEPISNDIKFPWGLRYDGESLWAIMCNKWLELGFNHDFFAEMLFTRGFFFERVPAIEGYVGEAWKANRFDLLFDFGKWELPSSYDATFYPGNAGETGRFCKGRSLLPGLRNVVGQAYELCFVNYGTQRLPVRVDGETSESLVIQPGRTESVKIRIGNEAVSIRSATFIPDGQCGNGDTRELGVNLKSVRVLSA